MATYRLYTFDLEEEFQAPSLDEARRIASLKVRRHHLPHRTATRWVRVDLKDEEGVLVDDWLEALQPEPPECVPSTEELKNADNRELERLWQVRAREQDGHLWAREGVIVKDVCLRCGTLRAIDIETWVEHPVTGREELRHIEYEPGRYAAEVEGVFSADEERRS